MESPWAVIRQYRGVLGELEEIRESPPEPALVRAWARRGAPLPIPTGAQGARVAWDAEWGDTSDMLSIDVNANRVTIREPGMYEMWVQANWAAGPGVKAIELRQFTSGGVIGYQCRDTKAYTEGLAVYMFMPGPFFAGHFIECWAFQDSGGAINLVDAQMQVIRRGRA